MVEMEAGREKKTRSQNMHQTGRREGNIIEGEGLRRHLSNKIRIGHTGGPLLDNAAASQAAVTLQ